jgi:alanine--tRNA ligase
MKSPEIRKRFFQFFQDRHHTAVPSSSLIPAQDPTLLFANAGMNQFKDVFLGKEKRSYKRAVSIQKCVRAGGKHNDLDNVGFTKRHLTFFEMMGNFSFGDYFKHDAIAFAWEFITKQAQLPIANLHVSIYETDDESYDIWHKTIGVPAAKIHRLGKADNFWQMGDMGPCGPCTEIFVDRGPAFGCQEPCGPACSCDRFLEIWNLVFMQFDMQEDGSLKPLKQTGVDTGMGLERLAAVLQNTDSVYETDLFTPIIQKTESLTGISYAKASKEIQAAFRVLADHIRSSTMIISDGGSPSNEGRGYVLRKIIRRAALFAQKLTPTNIFPELAKVVVAQYGDIYPELKTNQDLIVKILTSEIEKFSENLIRGQQILAGYLKESEKTKIITGIQAFKLYDTYGFPIELLNAAAREKGYSVDIPGFEKEMDLQREQSGRKTSDALDHVNLDDAIITEFTGYTQLETLSHIIALIKETTAVTSAEKNDMVWVLTKQSPFFIVGGGQVPDQGWLIIENHKTPIEQVRYINGRIASLIKTPITLKVGDDITSIVDKTWRINAMKNHTATHLLQAALLQVCGKQIKQAGSLVHPDYLRFDFAYHELPSPEDIKKIENVVNAQIRENITVSITYASFKEAVDKGVLAFFGEKYNPEQVRIVDVPGFSMELCGGTHVNRTGDIGSFKITEVSTISAGYRRIFAVTGPRAIDLFQETFDTSKKLCQQFSVQRDKIVDIVQKQADDLRTLQKQCKHLKQQLWHNSVDTWLKAKTEIKQVPFLFLAIDDVSSEEIRDIATMLQQKSPGLYFLVGTMYSKLNFFVTASDHAAGIVNMKNFATWLKDTHGLRGGASKNTIQGGGDKFDPLLKDTIIAFLKNN